MNYLELNKALEEVYKSSTLVNSVYDNSNLINQKSTRYWCVAFDIQNVTEYEEYSTMSYNIYAVERMNQDFSMINEHYQIGMDIIKEGLGLLEERFGVSVEYPIQYNMNSIRFSDVLDCVMASVVIIVSNDIDCD